MPTNAHLILVPENFDENREAILIRESGLIKETVRLGTDIFIKCMGNYKKFEDIVILMNYYNALSLLDSISVLIRASVFENSKIFLRCLLEPIFYIKYLLEADTEKRALSFILCKDHKEIRKLKRHDPATPEGMRFIEQMKKDTTLNGFSFPTPLELQKQIDDINKKFQDPLFKSIELEYQRKLKENKNKKTLPEWYSLFGGPTSIAKLAEKIGCAGFYEVLYNEYSGSVHSSEILNNRLIAPEKGDEGLILSFRTIKNGRQVVTMTLNLALIVNEIIIEHFMPEKMDGFAFWYMKEIQPHMGNN